MIIRETPLKDLLIIEQTFFSDDRGLFCQQYNLEVLNFKAVQSNISLSHKNVLRGLHYQTAEFSQAKLITVLQGLVLQLAVDLREGSPTYLQHFKTLLNSDNLTTILVPRGFANAILSLADNSLVHYLLDNSYNPQHEAGLLYNDPKLAIDWPCNNFIVSSKDKAWPSL